MVRLAFIAANIVLAVIAVGCTTLNDVGNIQEKATDPAGPIGGSRTVGQTFVSHYPRLQAVQVLPVVYESAAPPAGGVVTFHLRASPDPDNAVDLALASVPIAELKHNVPQRFEFPPILDSKDKSFYFLLEASETDGEGKASVWSSKLDTYPLGSRYVDGGKASGDLTFRTFYEYDGTAILSDLARGLSENTSVVVPLFAVLLLPGYILLALHPRKHDFDLAEMVALSAGLSIAGIGVGTLFAKLLGVRLDGTLLRVAAIVLTLLVTGLLLRGSPLCRGIALYSSQLNKNGRKQTRGIEVLGEVQGSTVPSTEKITFAACLILVLVVSTGVRFLHIRDQPLPMWVDSVQHAEIVQLIIANGGLPDSYQPFAAVEPFSYHFGFHALVAVFHWLTGMDVPGSMLVVGQALNALMPLSAYLLARRLMGTQIAGLVAATVVGTVSVMPAYYVSWGRYTQLTGMVLLPIVIVIVISFESLVHAKLASLVRWTILAAIATGGLIIAHPRVTVFYLCFVVAYLGVAALASTALCIEVGLAAPQADGDNRGYTFRSWPRYISSGVMYRGWPTFFAIRHRGSWRPFLWVCAGVTLAGVAGIAIILPWMWNILGSLVLRTWQGASLATPSDNQFPIGFITALNDRALLALAASGLVFGALKRHRGVILVALWTALMLLGANLHLIGLPGSTMVSNGAVAIALFLPISLLDGYLIASAARGLRFGGWPLYAKTAAAVVLIVVVLYGARGLLGVLNPSTILFFQEDSRAMEWITENTPKDAKFLINTYSWQYGIYAGTDGGYWIPALTGRAASLPSVLYALGKPEYQKMVSSTARTFNESLSDDKMRGLLTANGITHVYIGYRRGTLQPSMFLDKPGYRTVYDKGGVWVFEVENPYNN